jgi:hypothetical protein
LQSSLLGLATSIAAALVGLTFVWSGVIKAISPHVFQQHLVKLGIPASIVFWSAVVAAGFEVGWGVALILNAAPGFVLPATTMLLIAFSSVSWWGVKSGRATDCGCYGGYVVPSPAESLALNGLFAVLVTFAWVFGVSAPTPAWKLIAAISAGAVSASLAAAGFEYYAKHGKFMIEMSPLRVGRKWRDRWGARVHGDGEQLVSYLGPECPHCKQWVRVLNVIEKSPDLPAVVGVVATTGEKLDEFVTSSGIQFPMNTIPQTLMSRLVWGVPTTVLVADGKIQKQWSGQMSPEFFQRFRDAFFPASTVSRA